MSYVLLIITVLMWSFVGVMVKAASFMASSSVITLCRFFFGVVFLYLMMVIMDKKVVLYWKNKWIWIGVLGKCANYIFENIAITNGHAYGNVVIWPVQSIFIAIVAVIFFHEVMHFRKIAALLLCLTGVILVSFKGESLSVFFSAGFLPLLLFVFSAIGSGIFLISVMKLIDTIDSANLNLTMFFFCMILMSLPMPFTIHFSGHFSLWAVASLIGLGLITGISFYFNAEALKKIPFLTVTLISNSTILFTFFWAWLFFKETINGYIIVGGIVLVIGIVLVNIPENITMKNLVNARFGHGDD